MNIQKLCTSQCPFYCFASFLGSAGLKKFPSPVYVYKLTPTCGQTPANILLTISNWLSVKDLNPDQMQGADLISEAWALKGERGSSIAFLSSLENYY